MHFSFVVGTALLGLANANFDLYVGADNSLGTGNQFDVWWIHQTEPDCNRVTWHAEMWPSLDDVSGKKLGIRCEGNGCHRNEVDNINVLEMHFTNSPLYHWTIYKNRGHPYKMYGLDGKTYGECIMFPGDDFFCPNMFGAAKSGVRMFRCLTQWTVADIERAN